MTNYHPTVQRIKDFLNHHSVNYKCFEHEPVRTSEEAAMIRPEYSITQGETVRGTVARGYLIFLEVTKRNTDNLNRICKIREYLRFKEERRKSLVTRDAPGKNPVNYTWTFFNSFLQHNKSAQTTFIFSINRGILALISYGR